jgi:hypothetical protein
MFFGGTVDELGVHLLSVVSSAAWVASHELQYPELDVCHKLPMQLL